MTFENKEITNNRILLDTPSQSKGAVTFTYFLFLFVFSTNHAIKGGRRQGCPRQGAQTFVMLVLILKY